MKYDMTFLKTVMLFHGMDDIEIENSLKELNASKKNYKKRDTILHAGNRTDHICLVLSGSVTIENNDIWGNRTILSNISAGDFFAETYAILTPEPMLVDAVANEDSSILFLDFRKLVKHSDPLTVSQQKLLRNLLLLSSRKNLMLSDRSFHTSPKSVRGRVMAYLNSVSFKTGSREFDIPFDRQQMADYLNLERTALSKELGRMKNEGLIEYKKNHFCIT